MYGTKEELDKEILKWTSDITKGLNNSKAVVFTLNEWPGNIFMLFDKDQGIDNGIIAHESLHVLYHLYYIIGETINGLEKDAYLLQWVFNTTYSLINKKAPHNL